MPISEERAKNIMGLVEEFGVDAAADELDLTRESVRRYVRQHRGSGGTVETDDSLLRKIASRYSTDELKRIANGSGLNTSRTSPKRLSFDGETVKVGFCTDTHIGDESFCDYLWESFIRECEAEQVDMIMHAGDLLEGMSNRPDQIYHLTDIGFSKQMDHATDLLEMTSIPIKIIDGNHDRWGVKSGGILAVRDIANRLDHVDFLGHDTGDVIINGTIWRLWHGEDGSSYATSYRVQKLIEAFTGGDKPHVLLCGHTHKQGYFFERNIHAVSGGALSYQSHWMKSKRLACHTGFWIIEATIRDAQVVKMRPTWYPVYE